MQSYIPSTSPPGWRALCLFFHGLVKHSKRHIVLGGLSHAMGPIPSMPFHGHPLAAPCPSHCYPQAVLFSMPSQDYPTTITWASPGHVLAKPSQGRLAGAARQVRLPRPGSLS